LANYTSFPTFNLRKISRANSILLR